MRMGFVLAGLAGVMLVGAIGAWVGLRESPIVAEPLSEMREHALKPTDRFKECDNCPVMMVVPAGTFIMGSTLKPPDHIPNHDEVPRHSVTIARAFAVGQFEVTFDEWDACVAGAGCKGYRPSDAGFGRGRRPVINVSWADAKLAYLPWLSKKTGKSYRLLSEAEYEYAQRGGTTTFFPWGDESGIRNANCSVCRTQYQDRETAPVGLYPANAFGLYDMVGNVWEWTEDAYHDTYDGAPTDGSAWTTWTGGTDCCHHVLRGSSWASNPYDRSRLGKDPETRSDIIGFRVARTLDTP
jgi:formylglycine-generating enzyme required for sulfatase activity